MDSRSQSERLYFLLVIPKFDPNWHNVFKINEGKLLFNTFSEFHELLIDIFATINNKKLVSYASVISII